MKLNHALIDNNFTKSDMDSVVKLVKKKNIVLTQSKKVKEFEKKWSKWVGTRYSVFVNSGSSANFITISALKVLNRNTNKNEIIVPTLTWVSDINSVIMNGFKPVFVDINLSNLSMNTDQVIKKISKKTLAVFITHAQGFNGLDENLLSTLKRKNIHLIEDVCESHGAKHNKKKLCSYGLISNFSFYYAQHLTTIEGGMACTNDKHIYETLKMLRSHGMIRESGNKQYEKKTIKKNKDLSPKFIFLHPTLNFRNNEIGAVIGINQLKSLDKNNNKRAKNLKLFLELLDDKKYFKDFNLEGNSNYAFPIILQSKDLKVRDYFETRLKIANIEFRRGIAGGGNQLRQPYIKNIIKNINLNNFKNVEHVHYFGYYIGNDPSLKKEKIIKITNFLNKLDL
jgi:CDP-6-deoxy-D-xylo-4-hexulose-3-dehydrase